MRIKRVTIEFEKATEHDEVLVPADQPNQLVLSDRKWTATRPLLNADLNLMQSVHRAVKQRNGEQTVEERTGRV